MQLAVEKRSSYSLTTAFGISKRRYLKHLIGLVSIVHMSSKIVKPTQTEYNNEIQMSSKHAFNITTI